MNGEFDEGDDSVDRVGDFWQQISVLDQFLDANLANNVWNDEAVHFIFHSYYGRTLLIY